MYSDKLKNAKQFLESRKKFKARQEAERSGDIQLFKDQSKLFFPLITTQQETTEASSDIMSRALVPFTRELQQRNDQVETLQEFPYYQEQIEQPAEPTGSEGSDTEPVGVAGSIRASYDADLNTTDKKKLEVLKKNLPSVVFKDNIIAERSDELYKKMIAKITSENKSAVYHLGEKSSLKSKKSDVDKELIQSQKKTLEKYKESLVTAKKSIKKFVLSKGGKGLGSSTIYYSNPNELVDKFVLLDAAKQAGNTGVDNDLNSILDELLKIGCIDKTTFDKFYRNIF